MSASAPPVEPTRATLVKWLRLNLGVTMFILSIASGVSGAVVSSTLKIANYDFRLKTLEIIGETQNQRLDRLELTLGGMAERRVKLASDLGVINDRIGVLEERTKFVADFIRDSMTPQHPRHP